MLAGTTLGEDTMLLRRCSTAIFLFSIAFSAHAKLTCDDLRKALSKDLVDVTCFESPDLTTKNTSPTNPTTPANNSLPGLPAGAFTPVTDRGVISPDDPERTPITKAVPGLQINARIDLQPRRSEEHTSGLQSPYVISYGVFC